MSTTQTAGAVVLAAAVITYGLVNLRWLLHTRRRSRATAAWYRAKVAAVESGRPDPGRVEAWPGIADAERALLRLHPMQRVAGVAVLLAAAFVAVAAFV